MFWVLNLYRPSHNFSLFFSFYKILVVLQFVIWFITDRRFRHFIFCSSFLSEDDGHCTVHRKYSANFLLIDAVFLHVEFENATFWQHLFKFKHTAGSALVRQVAPHSKKQNMIKNKLKAMDLFTMYFVTYIQFRISSCAV